jgi:hypothetical protein
MYIPGELLWAVDVWRLLWALKSHDWIDCMSMSLLPHVIGCRRQGHLQWPTYVMAVVPQQYLLQPSFAHNHNSFCLAGLPWMFLAQLLGINRTAAERATRQCLPLVVRCITTLRGCMTEHLTQHDEIRKVRQPRCRQPPCQPFPVHCAGCRHLAVCMQCSSTGNTSKLLMPFFMCGFTKLMQM